MMLEKLLDLRTELIELKNDTIRNMQDGTDIDPDRLEKMIALSGIDPDTNYPISKIHAEFTRMEDSLKEMIRHQRMKDYVESKGQ